MKKSNPKALLPIGVFLILYLGVGILFEYVMKIPMGFYNIPIVIAFLAAILTACLQNRALNFDGKLAVMAEVPIAVETKHATKNSAATANLAGIRDNIK